MEIYNQTLRTKGEDQLSNPAQEVEKLHVDFGWEKLVLPLAICLFWRGRGGLVGFIAGINGHAVNKKKNWSNLGKNIYEMECGIIIVEIIMDRLIRLI